MQADKRTILLKSLLEELELIDLANKNPERWDAFFRRARMIIKEIFRTNSDYLNDLTDISLAPSGLPRFEYGTAKDWIKGWSMAHNLIMTMLEHLELMSDKSLGQSLDVAKHLPSSNKIFIVHGHDEAMKQAAARTLEKLNLNPIILHEKPSAGRTIIEKFYDYADVSFAIILLSPDDLAYPKDDTRKKARFRARQNVILELGYFLGKLGRTNVTALHKQENNFEIPSDYSGVLFIPFDDSGQWRFDLIKELQACGFDVDANKLTK